MGIHEKRCHGDRKRVLSLVEGRFQLLTSYILMAETEWEGFFSFKHVFQDIFPPNFQVCFRAENKDLNLINLVANNFLIA